MPLVNLLVLVLASKLGASVRLPGTLRATRGKVLYGRALVVLVVLLQLLDLLKHLANRGCIPDFGCVGNTKHTFQKTVIYPVTGFPIQKLGDITFTQFLSALIANQVILKTHESLLLMLEEPKTLPAEELLQEQLQILLRLHDLLHIERSLDSLLALGGQVKQLDVSG